MHQFVLNRNYRNPGYTPALEIHLHDQLHRVFLLPQPVQLATKRIGHLVMGQFSLLAHECLLLDTPTVRMFILSGCMAIAI